MSYKTILDNYASVMLKSLPRYLFGSYKRMGFLQSEYGACPLKTLSIEGDYNEDSILGEGICSLYNQLYLPEGEYTGDVATRVPIKIMETLSALIYHLMLGDSSTSYQLIDNISVASNNSYSENKFSSPVASTYRKVKVKPWIM